MAQPLAIVTGVRILDTTGLRATIGARVRAVTMDGDMGSLLDLRRHTADIEELARWEQALAAGARLRITVEIEEGGEPSAPLPS